MKETAEARILREAAEEADRDIDFLVTMDVSQPGGVDAFLRRAKMALQKIKRSSTPSNSGEKAGRAEMIVKSNHWLAALRRLDKAMKK